MKSNEINISYCVNFLKKAIEISHDKNYELIWKLPDIARKKDKKTMLKYEQQAEIIKEILRKC